MGRLIRKVFGNKTDVRGVRTDRNVVAGLPTRGMRLRLAARYLWARLAERVDCVCAALRRHAVSAVPCALGTAEPAGLASIHSRRHGRQRWPGHPRRGRGS